MWYGKAFVITIKIKEIYCISDYIRFCDKDIFLSKTFVEDEFSKKESSKRDINIKALIRGVFLRFWFY